VSEGTALETARLVVRGDRGELNAEGGRITISKLAPTRDAPTTVEFGVDQIRGAQVRAPSRGSRGWLHVAVLGGSPPPPGDLAAVGDPYALLLTSRSVGAARRFAKLVDRHVQGRGMPSEVGPSGGRMSSSVTVFQAPTGTPPPPPPPPPPRTDAGGDVARGGGADPADLVAELRTLAELHQSGELTDAQFERAKARVLG
jgi:hypothetical protein